jgi:uncharacterized protein (UPF0371 family)
VEEEVVEEDHQNFDSKNYLGMEVVVVVEDHLNFDSKNYLEMVVVVEEVVQAERVLDLNRIHYMIKKRI